MEGTRPLAGICNCGPLSGAAHGAAVDSATVDALQGAGVEPSPSRTEASTKACVHAAPTACLTLIWCWFKRWCENGRRASCMPRAGAGGQPQGRALAAFAFSHYSEVESD